MVDMGRPAPSEAAARRQAIAIVGILAGLVAMGVSVWLAGYALAHHPGLGPPIAMFDRPVVHAVAGVTGGLVAIWQWRLFARFRPQMAWGWAIAAGVVAVPVTYVLTIAVLSVGWEIVRIPELIENGRGNLFRRIVTLFGEPFAVSMLGAAYATMLAGPVHLPLSIAACLTGTWWARRGLRLGPVVPMPDAESGS